MIQTPLATSGRDYVTWVADAYPGHLDGAYRVGIDGGIGLAKLTQPAGRFPDDPCDDLTIQLLTRGALDARFDLGAGRFSSRMGTRTFVLAPPGNTNDFEPGGPHEVMLFAVPRARLSTMLGEACAFENGDFGVLHTAVHDDSAVAEAVIRVWTERSRGEGADALFYDSAAAYLVALLARLAERTHRPAPRGGLAPWQLRRALDLIEANFAGDVDLATLSAEVRLSTFHFCRAFKASMGVPPHRYQQQRRVERAKELLRASGLPIIEVAAAVGYENPSHFAALFRRFTGTTPSAWRREVER